MAEQTHIHNQEPDPQFTQRFIDAVDSVLAYNDRHTGMDESTIGLFHGLDLDRMGIPVNKPKVSHREEAEMEKQLVQLIQTGEMHEMGITLFDARAPGVEEADFSADETTKRPSALIMLITDGDKFINTLHHLNPTPEQEEQTKKGVAVLLSSTVTFIQAFYPSYADTEEVSAETAKFVADHQLDLFMELNPALVSRGFTDSEAYRTLSEYAARHLSGTLSDYREAEEEGLLTPYYRQPWADTSPSQLKQKWLRAFGILKGMRDRQEPSAYFPELFDRLRADFDVAKAWLGTAPTYGPEYDRAYAEWEKREAEFDNWLNAQKDLSPEERQYTKFKRPEPPTPPQGSYPPDQIADYKKVMDDLASEWEKSFAIENAAYLSEKRDSGT